MLCPNCSTENTDDAKFCMSCGGGLAAVDVAAPSPPAAETTLEPPFDPPAPPVSAPVSAPIAPPVDTASPANPWLPDQPAGHGEVVTPDVAPVTDVTPPAPPEPATVAQAGPPPEPGPPDPHGLEAHLARMSDATRPHAELPLLLASLLLNGSESVDVVVPGLIDDIVGVAVVTDQRVLLVNGRRWNPGAYEFRIGPGLVVEGWQDADTAMLTIVAEESVRIAAIVDKSLAFEAARVIRERVAMLQ